MQKFVLGFFVGILTIPVGAFAAAWMGWLEVGARGTPTAAESGVRAFGAGPGVGAASAEGCESDCAYRGKFDGRDENFQGRLRGLPWGAKQCSQAGSGSHFVSDSASVCAAPAEDAGRATLLDYQEWGEVHGNVLVGRVNSGRIHRGRMFRMKRYGRR